MACCGVPAGLREAFSIDTHRLLYCKDVRMSRMNPKEISFSCR